MYTVLLPCCSTAQLPSGCPSGSLPFWTKDASASATAIDERKTAMGQRAKGMASRVKLSAKYWGRVLQDHHHDA